MEHIPEATSIFEQALALHQQGRALEAQDGYREVLRRRPSDAPALKMLGILALQANRPEQAIQYFSESLSFDSTDPVTHIYKGSAHALCQEHEAAIACYDRVIGIDPETSAMPYYSRGNCQLELRQFAAAAASFERAIALESDLDAECYFGRGLAEQGLGQPKAAIASLERAIELGSGRSAQAHATRGLLLREVGDHAAALAAFDAALKLQPQWVDVLNTRGAALLSLGRMAEARQSFESAIALAPDHAPTLNNLARTLQDLGDIDAALSVYDAWMRVDALGAAFGNAGGLLFGIGRLDEAEDVLRRGMQKFPAYAPAHVNLGNVLSQGGDIAAALECYRQALRLDPQCVIAQSNLAFWSMFISEDGPTVLEECRRFGDRFAAAASPLAASPLCLRTAPPGVPRRLRIGYVSPDFRNHCQSCFTLPLLTHHDRDAFEVICYSTARRTDAITERIRSLADGFFDVGFLNDSDIAKQIRADEVDILIDLAMHMSNGRPLIFASRPAPVQIAWLAYPGTTGISAMHFRLSDPRLDPPGFDAHYTERTIRLRDSFWCYDPLSALAPVGAPPALTRGHVTFGCLNNPGKLTQRTLRLWAPVMEQVPNSRLLLLAVSARGRARILARAREAGMDPARVDFVGFQPREQYLNTYHQIDLCLDPFPYNGHTTSLDSLWMGVPVVTRVGATAVGRGGLSLLYHAGLCDLAADDDEGFVSAAVDLAKDIERLSALRRDLRSRLERSPLMNAPRFAAAMEGALRQAWAYHAGGKAAN
jgi:predicted O-linked N-acetylglucosamine transferase (SPINDLY family)